MLTVDQASRKLLALVPPPIPETLPLDDALGAVLARDVRSDLDLPPFDRATMDGYAVVAGDDGPLKVIESLNAGRAPTLRVRRGTCTKVMTGAPVPAGADAVQQREKVDEGGAIIRLLEPVARGRNIAPRGQDLRKGRVALRRGTLLRAPELALLASVGASRVAVFRRPSVALLATGDELVDPSRRPGPGRIRESNSRGLLAQLRSAGFDGRRLGIVRDDPRALATAIRAGLRHDVLILSGGVSAGDRDLVPGALARAGVTAVLHQVKIRPGRPFWFGVKGRRRVFALPGNPVSTLVTFEVFVRPFLRRMMGIADAAPAVGSARLAGPIRKKHDRQQYLPARLGGDGDVEILPWNGSGDLVAMTRADALAVQPIGRRFKAGEAIDVLRI